MNPPRAMHVLPYWIWAVVLVMSTFACGGRSVGDPAATRIPADSSGWMVVPSVGRLVDRLDHYGEILPGMDSLAKTWRQLLGVRPVGPPAYEANGWSANSDILLVRQSTDLILSFGRVDAAPFERFLRRRLRSFGVQSDPSGRLRVGNRIGRLHIDDRGVVTLVFVPLKPIGSQADRLERAWQQWDGRTESEDLPASRKSDAILFSTGRRRRAANPVAQLLVSTSYAVEMAADHVELRSLDSSGGSGVLKPLFSEVATGTGDEKLAATLPLDTMLTLQTRIQPKALGALLKLSNQNVYRMPGIGLPVDVTLLLLPFLEGRVALVGYGLVPGSAVAQLMHQPDLREFFLSGLRLGAVFQVSDMAGLRRAWMSIARPIRIWLPRLQVQQQDDVLLVRVPFGGGSIGLMLDDQFVHIVTHPRDLDSLLAVRRGTRSPLSRRAQTSRAQDTLQGRGCSICGYGQLVRLTRDLERTGLPTFHLQLLGSIYQLTVRTEAGEEGPPNTIRFDFMY